MADYHTVYKEPEGTTTEWEDLQVKYGNAEARPKPEKPKAWEPAEEERKGDDDDENFDDEPEDDSFLEAYRKKRMAEMKAASSRPQFGSVELIKSPDFVREVTNASQDVWVLVFLFKDGIPQCSLLGRALDELAPRFKGTKFVKIKSTDCIPNYPDDNLPTLLVYKGGQVKENFVGLQPYTMGGLRTCTPEGVALALCRIGPVLADPDESEEEVVERVRRDIVLGMVGDHK